MAKPPSPTDARRRTPMAAVDTVETDAVQLLCGVGCSALLLLLLLLLLLCWTSDASPTLCHRRMIP